jgi:hypothetical protein
VRSIPLSVGGTKHAGKYVAVVDDDDYDRLRVHSWTARISRNGAVYAYRMVRNGGRQAPILMHRDVFERASGLKLSSDQFVDHKDPGECLGLDNRRSNLRLATNGQNQANSRAKKNNKSGFKGVHWRDDKRCFHAVIRVNSRPRHIGYFGDPIAAARAYDIAALEAFGSFARTNFPVEPTTCL